VPVGAYPLKGEIDVIVPDNACDAGVTRDETEMNAPEMRSNNTNEELSLTVVN
jgi:hypothetical protein